MYLYLIRASLSRTKSVHSRQTSTVCSFQDLHSVLRLENTDARVQAARELHVSAGMTDKKLPESASALPYPKWWPFVAGALVGIALRVAFFGGPGERWGAMMGSFIYLVPVAVSAVTVYVAELQCRRSWGYYFAAGLWANALFVLGTLGIMVEGLICAIVIVPFFAVIGGLAALFMGMVCRLTRWPKHTMYCVAVLPLICGAFEPTGNLPQRIRTVERSIFVAAPRAAVWTQLLNISDIQPQEVDDALAFRIGVPPPLSAVSDDAHVRRVSMGKNVYFDQIEIERRELEYIRWSQRFYPDSFPAGSFDEHVVMGGEYFDISDVSYTLTPQGASTQLTIVMRYRVSTQFNWYADAVARLVLGNLAETLLRVYERRASG